MATINHVRLNNLEPVANATTPWLWALSRAMKKAGWKYKASSDGTSYEFSGDPALDKWGAGAVTNVGAAAASITAPTEGRAIITGLLNIVATDKGRFLSITGAATGANNHQHQIEEVLSATSVRIDARTFAVVSDANNGSLTWDIYDPTLESYGNLLETNAAWWSAQGPSILRIPLTTASIGNFIRGENIVQTTTAAEGEVLGYIFENNVGYLVVAPRVQGVGGGVHGWATANAITGGSSGATATQAGTAIEYVYEVVFAKPAGSTTVTQVLLGQFDTVAENTERFSYCATQAGTTITVHPGGGGTGNAFGAHAWVAWGAGTTQGTGIQLHQVTSARANVICADAIPESGYSADSSWALLYSFVTSGNPVGYSILGFQKLNDTEDGDLAPYVSVNHGGVKTLYNDSRTSAGTVPSISVSQMGSTAGIAVGTSRVMFNTWRRRGLSGESFAEVEPSMLYALQTGGQVQAFTSLQPFRVATSDDITSRLREPLWLVSGSYNRKMYKGTLKWIYVFCGGQNTSVFGSDPAWIQLSDSLPALVIGPGDGTTWVLNL